MMMMMMMEGGQGGIRLRRCSSLAVFFPSVFFPGGDTAVCDGGIRLRRCSSLAVCEGRVAVVLMEHVHSGVGMEGGFVNKQRRV